MNLRIQEVVIVDEPQLAVDEIDLGFQKYKESLINEKNRQKYDSGF